MNVYYNDDYVAAEHDFDTTRKSQAIAQSLVTRPIDGVQIVSPSSLTVEQLTAVHDPAYVTAVRTGLPITLAESNGFLWDPGVWKMATATNGGAVAAALDAMQHGVAGSLSSGLHHAGYSDGMGFCTFNGLALAAKAAVQAGARSVLILDLDAHCGGGTASLIMAAGDYGVRQMDVSVSMLDEYKDTGQLRLYMATGRDYLAYVEHALKTPFTNRTYDLVLYNAGMDPFEGSLIGGVKGITRNVLAKREQMVFEWCKRHGSPVAFVLAGGYTGDQLKMDALVNLHRLTITAAAN